MDIIEGKNPHIIFLESAREAHERFKKFYVEELKMWQFNSRGCRFKNDSVCSISPTEKAECLAINCPFSPLPK